MLTLPLAAIGQPLFGNVWLALLAVLGLVALLLAVVAIAGRWLAATHPDPVPRPPRAAPADHDISPETLAIIASVVRATVGPGARVSGVVPIPAPSVEALMLQWSLEGRRQIYTSHKVR